MKYLSRCGAAVFAFSLIAISTGPAPAVIAPMWGSGGGGGNNLAGMYSGSVTDSVLGTGTATANVVQSDIFGGGGDPYGGWLAFTFGSSTYSNGMSAQRNSTNRQHGHRYDDGNGHTGIHGIFVSIIGSAACTFTFKANFNPSSFQMSGEYQARTGCSGESGTFLLSQQCDYQETGSGSGGGNLRRNTSGSGPGACS